jgi:hypothetical protein
MKSLLFVACIVAFAGGVGVACGGPGQDGTTTPKGGSGADKKPAAAGDVSLEIPVIEIKGVIFEPEALGRPGMPLYQPRQKTTIDQQKKKFGMTMIRRCSAAAVLRR